MAGKVPQTTDRNKSKTKDGKVTKKRQSHGLAVRLKIIDMHKDHKKNIEIARELNIPPSVVSDTIRRKSEYEKYLAQTPSNHLPKTFRIVSEYLTQLDSKIGSWVIAQAKNGKSISQTIICEKARKVKQQMVKSLEESNPEGFEELKQKEKRFFDFKASRGWFEKFKKRGDIKRLKLHGEAASADHERADQCIDEFATFIADKGLDMRQVFNADETGLMWKRSPTSTYIPTTFAAPQGYKIDKKRITLLLTGNVAGHKLKPFVINQYKNPRSFQNINPEEFGIYWSHNKKAWMTAELFEYWITHCFLPEVEEYLDQQNLSRKVLLVLDNAGGHPAHIAEKFPNLEFYFLPPNTTSLIQPMDQGVIRSFKANYLRGFMDKVIDSEDNYIESAKNYTIKDCVETCVKSWDKVTADTVKHGWNKLLPNEDTGEEEDVVDDLLELIELRNSCGMQNLDVIDELESEFPDELLYGNGEDNMDDVHPEHSEQELDTDEEISEIRPNDVDSILLAFDALLHTISKTDPDYGRSSSAKTAIKDIAVPYRHLQHQNNQKKVQPKITSFLLPLTAKNAVNLTVASGSGAGKKSVGVHTAIKQRTLVDYEDDDTTTDQDMSGDEMEVNNQVGCQTAIPPKKSTQVATDFFEDDHTTDMEDNQIEETSNTDINYLEKLNPEELSDTELKPNSTNTSSQSCSNDQHDQENTAKVAATVTAEQASKTVEKATKELPIGPNLDVTTVRKPNGESPNVLTGMYWVNPVTLELHTLQPFPTRQLHIDGESTEGLLTAEARAGPSNEKKSAEKHDAKKNLLFESKKPTSKNFNKFIESQLDLGSSQEIDPDDPESPDSPSTLDEDFNLANFKMPLDLKDICSGLESVCEIKIHMKTMTSSFEIVDGSLHQVFYYNHFKNLSYLKIQASHT